MKQKPSYRVRSLLQPGTSQCARDEYLSSLAKLKEIYDTRTRAVAEAAFRLDLEWGMKQDLVWGVRNDE